MKHHFIAKLLLITAFIFCSSYAAHHEDLKLKETKMSLYLQDYAAGPNATLAAVAGIPGKTWDFFQFGTVFVTDDPITLGIDRNSPEVARGQGIYAASALGGGNTYVVFSIAFTNKEYNESTIELQGRSIQMNKVREISIVSGTGKFRFARGFATFETVFMDPSISYTVLRCNLTIVHFQ